MSDFDTIFALATPPGRSAVAIIRISGAACCDVVRKLTRQTLPPPREARVRSIFSESGEKIDSAVVTVFRAPNSFTGEDICELGLHGGFSVISSVSSAILSTEGVRGAEPGEFTRRAFRNGRIDLTQAEAISDLIDSETEFQRRQALRVLDGALGEKARRWKDRLLAISAAIASALDFSDEGDVDPIDHEDLTTVAQSLRAELASELASGRRSLALRNGFTVVIAGKPNSGKSSLFNALVGEDAAIVTPISGTTRDIISRTIDLDGIPVKLVDSAGIRETEDLVEAIGVERAVAAARSSDLVLWLSAADTEYEHPPTFAANALRVFSKCDLGPVCDGLCVSIYDPSSIERVRSTMRDIAVREVGDGSEGRLIRERHRSALTRMFHAIESFEASISRRQYELAAEDCREAQDAIAELVGETPIESVLGEVFSRFCIGK